MNWRMKWRANWRVKWMAILILGLLAATPPAAAQDVAYPAPPAAASASAETSEEAGEGVASSPEAEAAAEAIPTPRIAGAAEGVDRRLREMRATLAPDDAVERIDAGLPEVAARIDAQGRRQVRLLEDPTLRALDELESEWNGIGDQLPAWEAALSRRAEQVEALGRELTALGQRWRRTRAAAVEDGAPVAIVGLVDEVLAGVEQAAALVRERRATLLTLLTAVSAQANRISDAASEIESLRNVLVRRVFERDSEPIWSAASRERAGGGLAARLSELVAAERSELSTFVAGQRDRIPMHALLFVALALALRSARARVRRRTEEEEGLGRVAEVFELPLSVALLIAILATPWLYGHLPPSVVQLLGAAALVPTVLILRRFTAPPLLPLLNALVAFYFADRVRELTAPLPIVSRAIFVVEMVVAVGFLGWMLRPARLASLPAWAARTATLQALGLLGRVTLGLFAVALVAEVLGYSRLGHLLGGAVLESAYVGVIAYAAVRILDSLVTFALRVRPLGRLKMVQRSRYAIRRRIHRVLRAVALLAWARVTLDLFAVWAPLRDGVVGLLAARARVGSISFSLGDVLAFALTVTIAYLLSRFLRFVLEEDVYPRLRLGRGVPYAVSTFLHYAILLIGFVLAVAAMGIDLDRFALLAGAFGVGIGFGLQNVVNNFVSGLILLSERPVQVGDTIEAGGTLGEVTRIGIRSSRVRTWNGAELIVPNAELISERVTNWTLSDRRRRVDVPFGVAYGTDRERVMALMCEVAAAHPDVLDDPPPTPLFRGFGDSSLDFELRAWTDHMEQMARIASDLSMAIGDALDAAGIEVPFPQRDLHLRSVDAEALAALAREGRAGDGGAPGGAAREGGAGEGGTSPLERRVARGDRQPGARQGDEERES